jgi:hypothetical protein
MSLVCNYAIARFLPYAETEEFVNVGAVLHCPATGYLDFLLARRWSRVTNFFPELQEQLFRDAAQLFRVDLRSACQAIDGGQPQQLVLETNRDESARVFTELVRTRESLFRFGTVRTVLAEDPRAKLHEVFNFYVERQFARDREYQETVMARHLRKVFTLAGTGERYRQGSLGNEWYSVTLPFVYRRGDEAIRAIKPLDLNKETSTRIIEHGDQWINRVRRLRDINALPKEFLFAVQAPNNGDQRRAEAAREIETELRRLDMDVVPIGDEQRVVEFAKVA